MGSCHKCTPALLTEKMLFAMNKYVDPKANTYSLIEFQSKYSTEASCDQALFQLKWLSASNVVLATVPLLADAGFHCISARTRQLPSLVKWFLALYFVATNKVGISEMTLAKYIEGTLKTAWPLLHKIRSAMGERENTYKLGDCVETDDDFFGGKVKSKWGSKNRIGVTVALQLDNIERPQFLKMKVIPDAKGNIREGSTILNVIIWKIVNISIISYILDTME